MHERLYYMATKTLQGAFIFFLLFISCSYQTVEPKLPPIPTAPAKPAEEVIAVNHFTTCNLGIGQEREFIIAPGIPENKNIEYSWITDGGQILNHNQSSITFKAPDLTGKITISCQVKEKETLLSIHTFLVTVYKQVVVLKADDLVYVSGTIFPSNWNKYFELIDSMGISGTAGIIGNSLENAPVAYYDKIKHYHNKGTVEFWNHGYTHELGGRNAAGEVYHEFFNRDLAAQEKSLIRTQNLGRQKLGITFRAFGAPGNGIDATTTELIDASADIRIWFFGDNKSSKNILKRTPGCEIEYPVHRPSYTKFMENYKSDIPYLTLQFHPSSWNQKEFNDFRKILFHLQSNHVAFMKPTEFAETFFPELVNDLLEKGSTL